MFAKIKDNIGLIATALALMGSVGAGFTAVVEIVDTLTGIDDRMNNIEYEFVTLKDSTYVQNDIAVLYEKIMQLEMAAQNVGFDKDRFYLLEKWEYQEINDSITRMETQVQTIVNSMWELNDLKTRLAYLEANR